MTNLDPNSIIKGFSFWPKIGLRCLCLGVLTLAVQACVLYPKYERPAVEIPETWRITTDESSTYANIRWWEQFKDPVLDSLIEEALVYNNDLKVAIIRVQEFVGQLMIARSPFYPQISGNFIALREETSIDVNPLPAGFPRTTDMFTSLVSASYDLDLWGEIRSASDAAFAQLLGSVQARRTIVLDLVTAVATAYVQLRQYDSQLDIAQKTLKSRVESYNLAHLRYLGGLTSELPDKQAEAEMDNAEVQVLELEISVAQQENLLSVLIGRPPETIPRGLLLDKLVLPPDVPAGLPSELLDQRPEILVAEQALIAANAEIGVAKAQFFPNITLTGQYGNESLQLHELFTSPALAWQYAASLLQPFFTGGRLTGQLKVAEAQKWEAYYAYRQTVLNAFEEVDNALIAHQKSHDLLTTQVKREAALEVVLHLANLEYENGQVDYLNVLDAERNLFVGQIDLATAQAFTFLSLINLYKALGGGWVVQADSEALSVCDCDSFCGSQCQEAAGL